LKRNARTTLKITSDRAAHALHVLIADGKIVAKDVTAALKRREAMIADLRKRLAALELGVVSMKATGKQARKVRRKMTVARRAALKLHGQYLGHVRKLSAANRARIKAIREKSGVRAAIAAARKMAN
jgi:hypothetical protein